MALALSNVLQCPTSQFSCKNFFLKVSLSNFPSSSVSYLHHQDIEYVRICRASTQDKKLVCAASSAAGSSSSDHDFNPYQVLGVSPVEGFEAIKVAYTRKRKDAERRGDEATTAQLEKAYDKIMMAQLMNRKKGVTFGSFQCWPYPSYFGSATLHTATISMTVESLPLLSTLMDMSASVQQICGDVLFNVFLGKTWMKLVRQSWRMFSRSSVKDIRINLAISAVFTAWILIKQNADWQPLQYLTLVFVYRVFEKLKSAEPPTSPTFTVELCLYVNDLTGYWLQEDGEDEGRVWRMGKRLLRSIALVAGCISVSSLDLNFSDPL
ncbi:hypothetical protein Acr_18g0001400 [Actinidia rufa]|uniref:Uncharacterized protein n=1 Tax=Actinidia rufa TaxID=165716 RepID=A0A7J0G5A7_9ERIC|nr:hypothetical protein Acr_18g0001400 [Actinidia rufa]